MRSPKHLALAIAAALSLTLPAVSFAAGDVLAFVDNGTLYVIGDRLPNHVLIRQWNWGIQVAGYHDYDSSWSYTPVNGKPEEYFYQPIDAIVVSTGDRRDRVWLDCYANNDVVIADCDIDTGAGRDEVFVSLWMGVGRLRITTGQDEDLIWTQGVFEELRIDSGHGADSVQVTQTTVTGRAEINTGLDNDGVLSMRASFGELLIELGQGNDFLTFSDSPGPTCAVLGDAVLVGGQGDDDLLYGEKLIVSGNLEVIGFE